MKTCGPFMAKVIERTNAIKMGNPFDEGTMMGAQASEDQYNKILNYLDIGKEEGAGIVWWCLCRFGY